VQKYYFLQLRPLSECGKSAKRSASARSQGRGTARRGKSSPWGSHFAARIWG